MKNYNFLKNQAIMFIIMVCTGMTFNPMNVLAYRISDLYISLTLFYGGLTQRKSVLNTIGMSYTAFCTASVVWVVIGYSIAFSGNGAFFGNFDYLLLKGITVNDVEVSS